MRSCISFVLLLSTTVISQSCVDYTKPKDLKKNAHAGIIEFKATFSNQNSSFTHIARIWYKDSLTIQEKKSIHFNTDTSNITTTNIILDGYQFVDPRRSAIYEYHTFGDTAALVSKWKLDNIHGPAYTFYEDKPYKIIGYPEALSDTTIDNVNYRRARFLREQEGPGKISHIGYWRCDNKEKMFSLEKKYSDSIGCVLAKELIYRDDSNSPYRVFEVIYIRDSLTQDELKIFATWERNEMSNPVK